MKLDNNNKAVLLIGFGGPTKPDEVRPFLETVTRGRGIPQARIEEVAHHYEAVGGRSPYNEIVMRQAKALAERLRCAVYVGMRNWSPFLSDTLQVMARDGVKYSVGFVLAPHRSEASFDRYVESARQAQRALGPNAPEIEYVGPWHTHPLFVESVAKQVRTAASKLSPKQRERACLIFTAHSIPCAMAEQSRYAQELHESAALVADKLGWRRWFVAYQSRSGNPYEPWLGPDVGELLASLKEDAAVVMPLGFLCENVEILYDLDIEARSIAQQAGVTMVRASAVNDDPVFIQMIAELVHEQLAGH